MRPTPAFVGLVMLMTGCAAPLEPGALNPGDHPRDQDHAPTADSGALLVRHPVMAVNEAFVFELSHPPEGRLMVEHAHENTGQGGGVALATFIQTPDSLHIGTGFGLSYYDYAVVGSRRTGTEHGCCPQDGNYSGTGQNYVHLKNGVPWVRAVVMTHGLSSPGDGWVSASIQSGADHVDVPLVRRITDLVFTEFKDELQRGEYVVLRGETIATEPASKHTILPSHLASVQFGVRSGTADFRISDSNSSMVAEVRSGEHLGFVAEKPFPITLEASVTEQPFSVSGYIFSCNCSLGAAFSHHRGNVAWH